MVRMSLDVVDVFAPNPTPFEPYGLGFLSPAKGWDTMHLMQVEAIATRDVRAHRHPTLVATIFSVSLCLYHGQTKALELNRG